MTPTETIALASIPVAMLLVIIAIAVYSIWQRYDERNWHTVRLVGGYRYQQHLTKRKRRVDLYVPHPADADWLSFKTDNI